MKYTNNYNKGDWKTFEGVLKVNKNLCDRTNEENDNITDDDIFKELIGFYVHKTNLDKAIKTGKFKLMRDELNIDKLKEKIKQKKDINPEVKYFRQYSCLWAQTFNDQIDSNTYSKRIFSNKKFVSNKKLGMEKNKNKINLYKEITKKLLKFSEFLALDKNDNKKLIDKNSELKLTRWDGGDKKLEELKNIQLKTVYHHPPFIRHIPLTQLVNIMYMLKDLDKNLNARESNYPGPAKIFNKNKIKENVAVAEKELNKLKGK